MSRAASIPPLLVIGNVNVDLVMGDVDGWPQVGTEIVLPRSEMRAGGSAGNTALALSGLASPHRMIAAVGEDVMGSWLASRFDKDTCEWIVMDVPTTVTVGIVHVGGDRAFFTTTGHLAEASLDDILKKIPDAPGQNAQAIVSGGFLMPQIEMGTDVLLGALHARGWSTAIDPGWPGQGWDDERRARVMSWLALADHALLNEDEARALAGHDDVDAAIDSLTDDPTRQCALVVKRGARGAVAILAGQRYTASAPAVEVVDTVGAGDAFNAGYIEALGRGAQMQEALNAGAACASFAISTHPRRYR